MKVSQGRKEYLVTITSLQLGYRSLSELQRKLLEEKLEEYLALEVKDEGK